MRSIHIKRLARTAIAIALAVGLTGVPAIARAHCCKSLAVVHLKPVDPSARPRLRGTAELLDCFGVLSLVSVKVYGRVADGTQFLPALPGIEPIVGDWLTVNKGLGEGFIQGIPTPLTGRTIEVDDSSFAPILTGSF